MEVLKPGSPVLIRVPGKQPIEGQVLGVTIRDNVLYEVSWFSGDTRNTAYFFEYELDSDRTERVSIGFVQGVK